MEFLLSLFEYVYYLSLAYLLISIFYQWHVSIRIMLPGMAVSALVNLASGLMIVWVRFNMERLYDESVTLLLVLFAFVITTFSLFFYKKSMSPVQYFSFAALVVTYSLVLAFF